VPVVVRSCFGAHGQRDELWTGCLLLQQHCPPEQHEARDSERVIGLGATHGITVALMNIARMSQIVRVTSKSSAIRT
jgi:hypothetical protein